MDHHLLVATARHQHGLVTRHQVLEAGGTDSAIRRQVGGGRWERVREGVYVVGAAPSTWQQGLMAAVLAAGPDALAGRRSAVRQWSMVERSGRVQILVPDTRRVRLAGVEVHRTCDLPASDRVVLDGIPTTALARTFFDVSPSQDTSTIGAWLDTAMRDHRLDPIAVARRANELTGPGRPLPRSLMEALALRSEGYDPGRSALESRVLEAYARVGLPAPERQFRVIRPDGTVAFIDLAYPRPRVAIELDGWETHGLRSAFDTDRLRGNDLVLAGWHLLRFTWSMSDATICAVTAAALDL